MSFRIREEAERANFATALKKQHHIPSQTAFFSSVMKALKAASEDGKLIEWPVQLVTKQGPISIIAPARAVVITDPKGRVTYVDAEFTKMCGYTLDYLRGKKPGDILQGPATEQKVVRAFHRAIQDRKPFDCIITNYHANRTIYRVHIEMTPIIDSAGKLTSFHALEERVA